MAQTITAVRGNQSVNANGTSTVTLLTNGANSTRVIVNSLGLIAPSTSTYSFRLVVLLRNSTGGADIPVAYLSNNNVTNCYFVPGQVQTASPNGLYTQSSTDSNPDNIFVGTSTSVSSFVHVCPKSIWVGPSDLLIFKAAGINSACTVVWNFTTISES